MKSKKNPKLDLEKKRGLYLNLGLLVAGSLTLAAFTYGVPSTEPKTFLDEGRKSPDFDIEVINKVMVDKKTADPAPKKIIINPDEIIEKEVDKELNSDDDKINLPEPPDFGHGDPSSQGTGFGDPGDDRDDVFDDEEVEVSPKFMGGDEDLIKFIQKSFKLSNMFSPLDQGTIYLRLVVTDKGDVRDVEIVRGLAPYLDNEAIRVVHSMPKWTPGKYRGRNVSVRIVIPIKIMSY